MASQSRKHRGMRTQLVVAQHLAAHGWPHAESAGSGRPGSDVLGIPGLSIEVKARAGFEPLAWLRQATLHDDGMPLVCFRPNGMGETTVDQWPCLIRLAPMSSLRQVALDLAHEANDLDDRVFALTRQLEIKTAALEVLAADLTAAHVTIDRLQDELSWSDGNLP